MAGLNCVHTRGKWYVYQRGTSLRLLSGFTGSREELDAYIEANRQQIDRKLFEFDQRHRDKTPGWRTDAAKQLDAITKQRAARRKIDYDLSAKWLYEKIESINDRCEISGLEFDFLPKDQSRDWHRRPLAPSIDRINNHQGYDAANVRLVCVCVNIAINEWGSDLFYQMCKSVVGKSP